MRIIEISVEGLFGTFNHNIPFNFEDRITIIHGPNGFGKTATLRLINGIFNSKDKAVKTIPFKNFSIRFEDKSVLNVEKKIDEEKNQIEIIYTLTNPTSKEESITNVIPINEDLIIPHLSYTKENIANLNIEIWKKMYANQLTLWNDLSEEKKPTWLDNLRKKTNIYFIKTERLQIVREHRRKVENTTTNAPSVQYSVSKNSKDLEEKIKEVTNEYATLSQSLDSSFPIRLVRAKDLSTSSEKEIKNRLEEIEKKREELISVGLLEREKTSEFSNSSVEDINESNKTALSLYADDTAKKLSVFDELAEKIELFKNIINNRFQYKQVFISKDSGIKFETNSGESLSLESLSSGEQHELVLFYEFLFKVTPNSLVLIDEPEISLHVAWQNHFLRDLKDVTENAKFDVLLATHSPQIIADRWDLTVELKGKENSINFNGNGKRKLTKAKV